MKTLYTPRLILRDFVITDVNDFFEYASVPGVGENAGWGHHKSIDTSYKVLNNFIASGTNYAIVYKENNKVIGSLGITNKLDISIYENSNQKEIGYVLSKDYWGQGLMVEAVKRVMAHLFDDLNIYAISLNHFDFNNQSKRVIEKCGFKFIKEEVLDIFQLKKKFISLVYRITQEDYNIMMGRYHV